MNGARNIVAVYQLQNYLDVSVQPNSAPLPQGEGWYNAGDTTTLTISGQTIDNQDGSRLVFQGWNVDGQSLQSGVSLPVKMDSPHVVVAQYKQQYYLKVLADQGVPYGQGWYDAGSTAQIFVSTPASTTYGVSWVFNGWQGGVQSSGQTSSVLMDGPKTVIASWRSDPTVLNLTILAAVVAAILIVAAVVAYAAMGRRRNPNKIVAPYQQTALKPVGTSTTQSASTPVTKHTPPVKKKIVQQDEDTEATDATKTQ
jgi:hypothetical protein